MIERKYFAIRDCSDTNLRAAIFGSYLDLPRNSDPASTDESLVVAGWALTRDARTSLTVVARHIDGSVESTLNVRRNDVVTAEVWKHIYDEDVSSLDSRATCGFNFSVEVPFNIVHPFELQVLLQIDGVQHPWRTITIVEATAALRTALKVWNLYGSNQLSSISAVEAKTLEFFNWSEANNAQPGSEESSLRTSLRNVASPAVFWGTQALESVAIEAHERTSLSNFIREVFGTETASQLVKTAINDGESRLPNPFGDGFAVSRESFLSGPYGAVLRFVIPSGETFFVFQKITSADGIYFPLRNLLISGPVEKCLSFAELLVMGLFNNFSTYLKYALNSWNNSFAGVFASHRRPYHYFYDVAPAIEKLYCENLLQKVSQIVSVPGECFAPLREIYKLSCKEVVLEPHAVTRLFIQPGQFLVKIGMRFNCDLPHAKEWVDKFDDRFRQHVVAHSAVRAEPAGFLANAQSCFPLVWFGVTGQKRAWIEQVQGGAAILCTLAQAFPGLGVVFDGWTSAETSSPAEKIEISRDMEIANQIRALLPCGLKTFNLIGAKPIDKLSVAFVIDIFIANSLSGSLYVARFAQKPGVGHMMNAAYDRMINEHIHPRTLYVAKPFVRDLPNPENPTLVDHRSYSIYWGHIYSLIRLALSDREIIEARFRLSDASEDAQKCGEGSGQHS